jgi:hypothetical protein
LLFNSDQTDSLFDLGYPSGLAAADYVQLVIRGFLRRDASADELSSFGGPLTAGTASRASVVFMMLTSSDFKHFVAPVSRLYMAAFGRVPDAGGLDNWVAYVRAGDSLQSAADAFVVSPEFHLTYGSLDDTQYVTLLYRNVLNRVPDAPGLADWVAQLSAGASRGQVLIGFSESQEEINRFAPTLQTLLHYFTFLNAPPTAADLEFWKEYPDLPALTDELREIFLAEPDFAGGG